MPIPSSMEIPMKMRPRPAGTIIEVYPSTVQGLSVEIQSATASAAATSLWSSVILPPSSAGVWRYSAPIPDSTKTYYFKARYPAQPGYSAGPFTAIVSKRPGILPPRRPWDGTLRISTPLNDQGGVLPFATPSPGTFFSYAGGGPATPQMWTSFGWSSANLARPDGSTITVPAAPAAPAIPTTSTVAGGALAGRTRWVRVAYVKVGASDESGVIFRTLYPVSTNTSQIIAINNLLKVTSPADPGGGFYDGWCVLVGSASGSEYVQEISVGDPLIAFGTDWTEPVGGFSTTANSLWTANWKSITVIRQAVSTTHYYYPHYDIAHNIIRFLATLTASSPKFAAIQNGDRTMSLGQYGSAVGYSGVSTFATPGAGLTNSGNAGGGRLT